jgi:hypothetical protein
VGGSEEEEEERQSTEDEDEEMFFPQLRSDLLCVCVYMYVYTYVCVCIHTTPPRKLNLPCAAQRRRGLAQLQEIKDIWLQPDVFEKKATHELTTPDCFQDQKGQGGEGERGGGGKEGGAC